MKLWTLWYGSRALQRYCMKSVGLRCVNKLHLRWCCSFCKRCGSQPYMPVPIFQASSIMLPGWTIWVGAIGKFNGIATMFLELGHCTTYLVGLPTLKSYFAPLSKWQMSADDVDTRMAAVWACGGRDQITVEDDLKWPLYGHLCSLRCLWWLWHLPFPEKYSLVHGYKSEKFKFDE